MHWETSLAKTPPSYKPNEADRKTIKEVQLCIEAGKRWHNAFAKKVERRYDAWRGLLPENQDPPKGWRSNQHPPHLINLVEGMLSSLEEPNPVWNVKPRALPEMTIEEALAASDNGEIGSYLLTHQMRVDQFADKAGPFAHQDLVAGFTVGKCYWLQKKVRRTSWDEEPEMIYDDTGGTIDMALNLEKTTDYLTLRDDPTFEVRDVRDFMYPESATSLETAPWVIDRTYVTYDTLQRMEQLGVYKNVKYVKDTKMTDTAGDPTAVRDREMKLRNVDRRRGLVEVVELWTDNKVVTVANGTILLRNRVSMFWHGRKPFIICSAIPDLFQIPGISVIEGLASLQEMLWTLTNTRLDATRLAASVITKIRADVLDASDYEFAPEAQWVMPDMNAVEQLDMTAIAAAANATLQSEGIIRGDIMNTMGGLPNFSGAQSQSLPTDTATGVSIVTNIAQAVLARRKGNYHRAFGRLGEMFLELDHQYLPDDKLVEILGEEGATRYMEVGPMNVKGVWDVELEVTGDGAMKQQRRAEDQALVTMAMQSAAQMQMMGVPLNVKAFWERLLKDHGITNTESFFMAPTQQGAMPGAPPSPPNAQIPGGGGGGITNESLAAGPTSPSSPISMSPEAPMARAMSKNGAGRSA